MDARDESQETSLMMASRNGHWATTKVPSMRLPEAVRKEYSSLEVDFDTV